MRVRHFYLQKRFLCSETAKQQQQQQPWRRSVKQVTKSNFSESLEDLKTRIVDSDFIAVSSKTTGGFSAPWRRFLPFLDTSETAFLKAKDASERFQILQFMVCPFTCRSSDGCNSAPKVVAYPYNFHLFPRDELNIGMPSYSFSCQSSYLTNMAREGFDFNACIYDGISYLSRAQEPTAKDRLGKPMIGIHPVKSSSAHSVADAVFVERIRSRVQHWRNACKENKGNNDPLVKSLRKLILGGELHGSRPCMNVDVCNEHQVQLVLEMLREFSSDLVPLLVPGKGGATQAVRVVLTSSEEDKYLLVREIQDLEEEENKRIRGFREVIDIISASQKPIVAYDCLNEFTFIHSKFLSPVPPSMNEFTCSLRMVFPQILNVNHLLKEISHLEKASNIAAAFSYLKRRFFAPVDMEIPDQALGYGGGNNLGHSVLLTVYLFAKLISILKMTPAAHQNINEVIATWLRNYMNIFTPCSTDPELSEGANVWVNNTAKISIKDLVFVWGFRRGSSAEEVKSLLRGTHDVFSEDFDVQLVDKSCAIVAFSRPGLVQVLLDVMGLGGFGYDSLKNLISEGLKASGYEVYKRVCIFGLWETDLADAMDRSLAEQSQKPLESKLGKEAMEEVYWSSDSIKLD